MEFKPGDICITSPDMAFDCLLVLSVDESAYRCISLKSQKYYRMQGDQIEKLGEVSPAMDITKAEAMAKHTPVLPAIDDLRVLTGRARAKKELVFATGENRVRWQMLADAKPGDTLAIHQSGQLQTVIFHYVLERAEKYVFLAQNRQHKLYRYVLNMLCPTNSQTKKA